MTGDRVRPDPVRISGRSAAVLCKLSPGERLRAYRNEPEPWDLSVSDKGAKSVGCGRLCCSISLSSDPQAGRELLISGRSCLPVEIECIHHSRCHTHCLHSLAGSGTIPCGAERTAEVSGSGGRLTGSLTRHDHVLMLARRCRAPPPGDGAAGHFSTERPRCSVFGTLHSGLVRLPLMT